MDKHDEHFESFLRKFQLRKVEPLPEIVLVRYRFSTRWFIAAAAVVVLVFGLSVAFLRNFGGVGGPRALVEAAGSPSLYRAGEAIEAGSSVRSNSAVGLLLALEDGSRVEMHAQSELKLEAADDGIRVRLNGGSIVVTAAKQGAGHLYVQTRDALVSVVGTVFLVNAEQSGTTVAVVEGEVHVQQGAELKKLLPGEQVATNPAMQLKPLAEAISWSRNATEYVALLPQPESSAQAAKASPPEPETGGSSMASYQQAVVRFEQGDINTAVQLFRDALNGDLKPKWLEVWSHINIGKIYDIRGGQRDRAVQEYQKAVNTGDDTYSAQAEARKYLGAPFSLSGPTQQAVAVPYPSLTPPALLAQQQAPAPASYKALPFKVQANYVRVTSDQVRTLITIQFTNRDLAFRDEGGGKKAVAHIEGVVYRIDNSRLPGFSEDVALEFPSNTFAANLDQPTLFQESRYLVPGKYKLRITVEDRNAQSIGVQEFALSVPSIPDQELQASSMILAYSITDLPPRMLGTDMFALGEKRVKPNVTGVFRTNENLNVWQEIYGLTIDPASRKPSATLELVISQNRQEIRKLTSNVTELLSREQKMIYTTSVPLGNIAPGPYDVQIKVTDNLAKASFVTVGKFIVASSVQSNPPANAGRQILDRTCTSCHNAEIAMRMESRGAPLSNFDWELLAQRRWERAALLARGLTDKHPDVVRLQSLIAELEAREVGVAGNYRSYVSRHLAGFGTMLAPEEVSTLSQYLLDEVAKRIEPPSPSDTPLQRQRFPPQTPLVK